MKPSHIISHARTDSPQFPTALSKLSPNGVLRAGQRNLIMGQSKGIEYFKRLARQDPILVNGHSKQAVLLTAGEFPIIIYSDIARTEELKRRGAPVEWVRAEPHITVLVSAAITREARHPAAARLFINYLAADEGQKEVVAMREATSKYQTAKSDGAQFLMHEVTR